MQKVSLFASLAIIAAFTICADRARASDDLVGYGEYLSGECAACHRKDGKSDGIPSIIGWEPETFVTMLKMFKTGDRKADAMESVARSLDDEQMQALALYYQSLKSEE